TLSRPQSLHHTHPSRPGSAWIIQLEALGDGGEPTRCGCLLARRLVLRFFHLEHRSPAEIAAVRTFGRFEVVEAVETRDARGSALKTLNGDRVHAWSIGGSPEMSVPPSGEAQPAPLEMRSAAARRSSQEQSLTRGRPDGSPAARSASSIAVQPVYSTT